MRVSGGVSERFAHNVNFGPRFSIWNGSHSRCMVGRNFLTSTSKLQEIGWGQCNGEHSQRILNNVSRVTHPVISSHTNPNGFQAAPLGHLSSFVLCLYLYAETTPNANGSAHTIIIICEIGSILI